MHVLPVLVLVLALSNDQSELLRQNQFAQTCGLQAVGGSVVVDFYCFLSTQQVGAVHTSGDQALCIFTIAGARTRLV